MTAPAVVRFKDFSLLGPYHVIIPHRGNRTVTGLVEAGRYSYASRHINDTNFPDTILSGDEAVTLYLALDHPVRPTEASQAFELAGFRAGGMSELLTFGKDFPNHWQSSSVYAIGQKWRHPRGDELAGFIGQNYADTGNQFVNLDDARESIPASSPIIVRAR